LLGAATIAIAFNGQTDPTDWKPTPRDDGGGPNTP
jgi:hypothetical protein